MNWLVRPEPQAVLLELHRADVVQGTVWSGLVVPERPREGFNFGVPARDEAPDVQPLHFQRDKQRFAAGIVSAVATPAHRRGDHPGTVLVL